MRCESATPFVAVRGDGLPAVQPAERAAGSLGSRSPGPCGIGLSGGWWYLELSSGTHLQSARLIHSTLEESSDNGHKPFRAPLSAMQAGCSARYWSRLVLMENRRASGPSGGGTARTWISSISAGERVLDCNAGTLILRPRVSRNATSSSENRERRWARSDVGGDNGNGLSRTICEDRFSLFSALGVGECWRQVDTCQNMGIFREGTGRHWQT